MEQTSSSMGRQLITSNHFTFWPSTYRVLYL